MNIENMTVESSGIEKLKRPGTRPYSAMKRLSSFGDIDASSRKTRVFITIRMIVMIGNVRDGLTSLSGITFLLLHRGPKFLAHSILVVALVFGECDCD